MVSMPAQLHSSAWVHNSEKNGWRLIGEPSNWVVNDSDSLLKRVVPVLSARSNFPPQGLIEVPAILLLQLLVIRFMMRGPAMHHRRTSSMAFLAATSTAALARALMLTSLSGGTGGNGTTAASSALIDEGLGVPVEGSVRLEAKPQIGRWLGIRTGELCVIWFSPKVLKFCKGHVWMCFQCWSSAGSHTSPLYVS